MEENAGRILLIEPPFVRLYHPCASLNKLPLSLGYLAGAIHARKPGWEVGIYNADFAPQDMPMDYRYFAGPGYARFVHTQKDPDAPLWKEIAGRISAFRPSVVGITAKSQNYLSACIVAKIVKSLDTSIPVVVGGPHPSLVGIDVLKAPAIDMGVRGEGEETIVEILDAVDGGRARSSIKGIVYRDGAQVVANPPRGYINDLDSLTFPIHAARRSLIDYDKYPPDAFKYIFAVRGCPYACAFCGSRYLWGRNVRWRSVPNIVAEMQEIRKAGLNHIHFDDDTFGVRKTFLRELCQAIKSHCTGLQWSCETHVRLVDEETVALMKSAGCRSILMGVESGNNEMLDRIGKNITIEEAFSAARIIRKHGIHLGAFFMVGFPEETEDSLNDTIAAITSLPSDTVVYSIFTPYPGTELFEWCRQQGIIPDDFNVSLHNHQSPENYFCPKIAKEVFQRRLRELEKTLDKINSRRKLRMYLSREGLLRLQEKGLRRTISQLLHLCRNTVRRG
jgi:radical SAM superfamily enzyme YgiQ (UPF0313 family)